MININNIKYSDKLIILPNCVYMYEGRLFKSIDKAIKYARSKNPTGIMKSIIIFNDNASDSFPNDHATTPIRDVKDKFCVNSKIRTIRFSNAMDEIYMEHFSLNDGTCKTYYNDFTFDYSILYDENTLEFPCNGPYGKFISTILPFPITITRNEYFFPKSKMDLLYKETDVLQVFRSNVFLPDGDEYYFYDFGYPCWSIPASTLRELKEPPNDLIVPKNINIETYPFKSRKPNIFDMARALRNRKYIYLRSK